MAVIYADTLFAVNFSMDFLALYITGKSLKTTIRPLRLAASAVFGSLFATVTAILPADDIFSKITLSVSFVLCVAVMCLYSYQCRIIRSAAVFTAVNLGLGGIIGAMCGLLRKNGFEADQNLEPLTLIIFGSIAAAISLAYGKFYSSKPHEVECKLLISNKLYKLELLSDSGNLLCEPISGKKVVLVNPSAIDMFELSPENVPPELLSRLRAIPSESIAGKRLIYGFSAVLDLEGKAVEAVIAPLKSDYNGLDGIIPESLC